MPAAVNPATVAEPKAIRIIVATSHPKTNGESDDFSKNVLKSVPIPLSISTCLKAPPAAIIKIIIVAALIAPPDLSIMSCIFLPLKIPNVNTAKSIAISIEMVGFPINIKIGRREFPSDNNNSLNVAVAIKITGTNAVIILILKEGISASVNVLLSNNPFGGKALIFFINSGNIIPATKSAGTATINPYRSVFPILALKITAIAVG